jgi:tetratricopeptide (TPR) repeat protein
MQKTKKYMFTYIFIFLVVSCLCLPAGLFAADAESEKEIFDRARLALFDSQPDRALKELNRLMELFPKTAYYQEVLFYKGRCYEAKKMPGKALEYYNRFLELSQNEGLKEEATRAIIDMNFLLYQESRNTKYLEKIVQLLKSRNEVVRYYAAFKLSYAKDKSIASEAVPVLRKIIKEESDRDLVDRAKICLLRINPDYLKKLSKPKSLESRVLKLQVYDKERKRTSFSFNIPFMFAQLALDSLPEKEKKLLRDKGYDLDKIVDTLVNSGEIIKIESEDAVFKIWIE